MDPRGPGRTVLSREKSPLFFVVTPPEYLAAMVRGYSSVIVQWFNVLVVAWCNGSMVQWCNGEMGI